MPQADAALRDGRWERSRFSGVEVADKTLGLLGFGRIGQLVAGRARGLGMRVIAYDPYVGDERFRDLGVTRVERPEDVYEGADFISLHLPLTPETRHAVDARALASFRPGARLVNAARGDLVDTDALVEALRDGRLAGAAIDVFEQEPLTSSPLFELSNAIVTPHLAASTAEAQDRAGLVIAEQVVAALRGASVRYALNIPHISEEDLEVLGPFVPLAEKLGRLAMSLARGRVERIEIATAGQLAAGTCACSRWPPCVAPSRGASTT